MNKSMRSASFTGFALIILILASIVFIDHSLARYINENYSHANYSQSALSFIEAITGFTLSKYLPGIVAVVIGAVRHVNNRRSDTGKLFFYVGATHIVTALAAGMLQNVFLRENPVSFIESGEISNEFFLDGSSFPSEHAAYFFGLILPIVFIFPRKKWLLALPVFVVLLRILTNNDYLGNILLSVFIALLFTSLFAKWLKIKPVM